MKTETINEMLYSHSQYMKDTDFASIWKKADFSLATIENYEFCDENLSDVSFKHAKLKNVVFVDCQLEYADFTDAVFDDVEFDHCDFRITRGLNERIWKLEIGSLYKTLYGKYPMILVSKSSNIVETCKLKFLMCTGMITERACD